MKDIIILEKAREKKLSKSLLNTTIVVEVAQVFGPVDFGLRSRCVMSNINIDIAKKLGQTRVKKY